MWEAWRARAILGRPCQGVSKAHSSPSATASPGTSARRSGTQDSAAPTAWAARVRTTPTRAQRGETQAAATRTGMEEEGDARNEKRAGMVERALPS